MAVSFRGVLFFFVVFIVLIGNGSERETFSVGSLFLGSHKSLRSDFL